MTAARSSRRAAAGLLGRFASVGAASTLLYATLAGLGALLTALPAAVVSLAAYAVAALFSYAAHRRFTFASDRPHRAAAPRFAALSLAGYAIALVAPLALTDWAGLPAVVPIALTSLLVPIINLLAMERLVFRTPATRSGEPAR